MTSDFTAKGRDFKGTHISHQLLLTTPGNRDTPRPPPLAQDAPSFPRLPGWLSATLGTAIIPHLAPQDLARNIDIADFDIRMAHRLPLLVQQNVHSLEWLLEPLLNLGRGDVLIENDMLSGYETAA